MGRTVRDALGWNTAATVLKYVSLVAVVIAISTVVLVVSKVAPPIQLITVPLAVAILLQSQLALPMPGATSVAAIPVRERGQRSLESPEQAVLAATADELLPQLLGHCGETSYPHRLRRCRSFRQ